MIYGPFYLLLVYSFIKGKNWIRPMALVCTSAKYFGQEATFIKRRFMVLA
jgi:hypothetical protein